MQKVLLTRDELIVLYDLLSCVGGSPINSPRKHASSLLRKLGPDPRPGQAELKKDRGSGSIYYADDSAGVELEVKES